LARIRSIKPTFWTNEDLAELGPWHRLCFIGLWNHADREGRLEDRPRRLKAAIFPFDDQDMDSLLAGLHDRGFIVRYTAEGAAFIQVVNFLKHQRPKNDEHVSLIPAMVLEIPRGIGAGPRGIVTAPRIGGKREEVGDRTLGERDSAEVSASPDDLMAAWNELTLTPIPRCRDLTIKRRKQGRARLTERPLTEWRDVFSAIQASAFCRGENDRGWSATFDWVIGSPEVALKVLEGKYADRRSAPRPAVKVADGVDWWEECQRLHNRTCNGQHGHALQMGIDAQRKAAS
jgi:hypothetical protein